MSMCKHCWEPDPVNEQGLCSWCAMTPEEQNARMTRDMLLGALAVVLILAAFVWSYP